MTWECVFCGTENEDENEICSQCGSTKEEIELELAQEQDEGNSYQIRIVAMLESNSPVLDSVRRFELQTETIIQDKISNEK